MESIQTEDLESVGAEHGGKLAALAKCAHAACTCTIESDELYCSDYCIEQEGTDHAATHHECDCGHPECAHATVVPGPFTIPSLG